MKIKFRGKTENDGWKYGHLDVNTEHKYFITNNDGGLPNYYEVDKNSVGLCTGYSITQDIGEAIDLYQGDIVKDEYGYEYTIVYDSERMAFVFQQLLYFREVTGFSSLVIKSSLADMLAKKIGFYIIGNKTDGIDPIRAKLNTEGG